MWFDAAVATFVVASNYVPDNLMVAVSIMQSEASALSEGADLESVRRGIHDLSPPAVHVIDRAAWTSLRDEGVWASVRGAELMPGSWWLRTWLVEDERYAAAYIVREDLSHLDQAKS